MRGSSLSRDRHAQMGHTDAHFDVRPTYIGHSAAGPGRARRRATGLKFAICGRFSAFLYHRAAYQRLGVFFAIAHVLPQYAARRLLESDAEERRQALMKENLMREASCCTLIVRNR